MIVLIIDDCSVTSLTYHPQRNTELAAHLDLLGHKDPGR